MMGESRKSGTDTSWIKELLPVAVLAGLGYLAYSLLSQTVPTSGTGQGSTLASMGGGSNLQNQQAQANVATQASQNNSSNGSPGNNQSAWQQQMTQEIRTAINTPGVYVVPGYQGPSLGTGINNLFVEAGPATPAWFSPLGNVVTASRELSVAEQQKVLTNLMKSDIKNAWWQPGQTLTQTTQPGGLNSGSSFQSNIPVGRTHCKCPYPGCGPNDDWTYC